MEANCWALFSLLTPIGLFLTIYTPDSRDGISTLDLEIVWAPPFLVYMKDVWVGVLCVLGAFSQDQDRVFGALPSPNPRVCSMLLRHLRYK